ncbi:ubiquitin carboxyl-terminal hydrolase 19 isoform X2 [Conger conger]|uniref:ubiquitin carboxyl-terminal hydrolase 19 isoform X2 n=1 Tax=Conger conger TaxID=82655 RepID=UPI002A5A60D1|nr:ubiquitin carboxyl-terminal hydrolase 19 isoform X2 [Conger conger]
MASSNAEAAGRRRGQRGTDDSGHSSTSKKKQKDRANQESREAKRTASAEAKKDAFLDWKQNANDVMVKLRSGDGVLKVEDVSVAFSDTACQVRFPDGSQWGCHLHAEIESSCSKVQYKEKGSFLQLVMQKKIPFNTWPSLMAHKKEKEPVNIQTENSREQPVKLEKVVEKVEPPRGSAQPSPLTEQKRNKPERGVKRSMKNKLSDKGDTPGAKDTETAAHVGKGDLPAEPSAKRTSRPVRGPRDPEQGLKRDAQAKGPANGKPEGRGAAEAAATQNGRLKQASSAKTPAATQVEASTERNHGVKSQVNAQEEESPQTCVSTPGSGQEGPTAAGVAPAAVSMPGSRQEGPTAAGVAPAAVPTPGSGQEGPTASGVAPAAVSMPGSGQEGPTAAGVAPAAVPTSGAGEAVPALAGAEPAHVTGATAGAADESQRRTEGETEPEMGQHEPMVPETTTQRTEEHYPARTTYTQDYPVSKTGTQDCSSTEMGTQDFPSSKTGPQDNPASKTGTQDCPTSKTNTQDCPSSSTGTQDCLTSKLGTQDNPASKTGTQDNPSSKTGTQYTPASKTGTQDNPASKTGTQDNPASKTDSQDCPTSKSGIQDEKTDKPKEESLEKEQEAPEPMVNLKLVKNDSYEKGTDLMVVNVYMKGICRETAEVLFREQDFTLIFQTSDANFLRLHPDCGPKTVFKWQVKLRNLIHPDQSMYAFTPSRIDITLKKRHSQRWGGLEAPATQVGGAKVAVPSGPASLDKTQPGSSQHTLPAKEEPRVGEQKEKAPRTEDTSGLDTVAARTVTEHVPLKQEPLVAAAPKPTCMVPPMTHAPPAGSERAEEEEEKKVCLPGFTGLVNLGNTCFMNSVIQSLSNTRELRDYFHDRGFETEINCSNPLGTGGRLAIGFAVLLRALWKGTHHAFQPSKLKAIVASKASQFTGYAQHDAQEFMAFLLDGLHEDLNRIQNKPYTETVDSDGRLDEVVAEEAWQRHKMRNDSFIVDLFQGQYKSKLVCPICSKVSITFDPFLYLPVPLPQKQKILTVFYFAKEPHKKPIKFLVSVSKDNSSTAEVLESISRSVRIKTENLRLAEVVKCRFHRIFLPSHSLDTISPSDTLFCFEVLSKELAKERVVVLQVQQRPQVPSIAIAKCAACQKPPQSEEEKLKRCTRCYRVGYCNQTCQKNHWPVHKSLCRPNLENVGLPFLVSVPESRLTYARLTQLLEGYSRYSVNVFQPPFQSGRVSPEASQCRADPLPMMPEPDSAGVEGEAPVGGDGDCKKEDGSPAPEGQASGHSAADQDLLSTHTADSGFSEPASDSHDPQGEKETSYEKAVKPEAAVTGYQQPSEAVAGPASQFYISLLDSANKEQKLEDKGEAVLDVPEDATLELVWKNNERLKEYVLVRSKELEFVEDPGSASETARAGHFTLEQCLNLFTKPEVLAPEEAWYCPKCQQHREASKQLMLWRLPNVLIIQLKRFSFRSFIWRDKINDMVDFPVRNLDLSKFCIGQKDDVQQPPIYDLYAVINHYGGMIGGHYTAYARLPSDKNSQRSDVGWRLFDDSTVTTVEESQVVTRYAYVLFYRRRNSPVERPARLLGPLGAESPAAAGATASQASSQTLFGADLDPEGPPQLTPEVTSDLFAHSGDCATPSYSNMEEVD